MDYVDYSLVSKIAYEKLCDIGPEAAIDFVLKCVPGIPEDYAVAVVLGKGWLTESEDDTMVNFTTERPEGYFETPDLKWLCQHRMEDMKECITCLIRNYDMLKVKAYICDIKTGDCTVDEIKHAHNMMKEHPSWNAEAWYSGVWGDISCDEPRKNSTEVLARVIYVIKNMDYLIKDYEKSVQLWRWAREICGVRPEKDVNFYRQVANVFNHVLETDIDDKPLRKKLNEFKKRIKALMKIDPYLNDAIEKKAIPADIMDGYDAGWLAPDGTYYGADGATSALLHILLADELCMDDRELEVEGWVKIHHNTCYSRPAFMKDENPSEFIINPDGSPWNGYVWSMPQLNAVCKYIDKFYHGEVNLEGNGYRPKKTSELQQMDIIALHEALE